MPDFILVDGDKAAFLPNFGIAIVVVRPGDLKGSGPGTLNGKPICIAGDERNVAVTHCSYITPQYPIAGLGTLKIAGLANNQQARKTRTGGKAVLLKGGQFRAAFEVQSPAKQPPVAGVSASDPTPKYSGSGMFITDNTNIQGS